MPMVFPSSPTVGQVFSSGGRSWVWTGSTWDSPSTNTTIRAGLQQVLYFTSSGTFTKATYPWLRAIRVRCQGAGGGGGGVGTIGSGQVVMSKPGTGGVYAESFITDIAGLPASVTVTRGAGGSGGSAGNNAGASGGSSSFGSLVVATGGFGGGTADFTFPPNVPAGGVAAPTTGVGDLIIPGGDATNGLAINDSWVISGIPGNSFMAPQTSSLYGIRTLGDGFAGAPGKLYGGGGTPAGNTFNGPARAGGAGANGIVIVELYA